MEKRDTGINSLPRRQHGSGLTTSMSALLMSARKSVWPSGGAFAASRAAIRPFAPGRFSTMTGCPNASESFVAIWRARMSGELPATDGTTMRSGRTGNCAAAMHEYNATARATSFNKRFIGNSEPSRAS